ncbi:MAG: aminotransferase class I/II-fold pyridoxal phosphate-dependent enzyme [Bdellovibrionota bacterium]
MAKKVLRRTRYQIKDKQELNIHLTSLSGERILGKVREVSSTGLSFELQVASEELPVLKDQVLSEGKLVWEANEWAFGRSVVKFVHKSESKVTLGIMFIDSHAPIEGPLSKCFKMNLEGNMAKSELEYSSDNSSLADFLGKDDGSVDIFNKAKKYHFYHNSLQKSVRWGYWIPREPSKGIRVTLTKKRSDGRNDFIVMSSNDYLGLSARPEVVEATKIALDKYGFGATGSPITCGQTEEHERLQETLSRMFRTEATTLFNSGYAANIGLISSLVGPNDLVIADILSHASIYDGMQLSQGVKRFFKHNDMDHLEKVLSRTRYESNGCLIVAEGVFSMDGDAAPLNDIVSLAKKYDARVMIDEAHSFGVLGKNGLGLSEESNLLGGIDLTMGTFSKICGTIGGFACGSKELIDWLNVSARSVFFSVALPPSTVAATNKSLELFQSEPQLLGKLRSNIEFFTSGLRKMGFDIPKDHKTAIVPVVIGDEEKLGKMYKILYDSGIYTIPVVYPAVSKNTCRFRFTVSAQHSLSDLDYALLVIKRAMEKVGLAPKEIALKESA